jgi:hypothetical protein
MPSSTQIRPGRRLLAKLAPLAAAGLLIFLALRQDPGVAPAAAPAMPAGNAPATITAGAGIPASKPLPMQGELEPSSNRMLSVAGTVMPSQPLPRARPIPIKAREGEVIGFALDANGTPRPLRAGQLPAVPNSPGTFATVDMWAEDQPVVVAPQRSAPLTPEQARYFENRGSGGEDGS